MPSPSNRSIRIFLGLFILIGVGALGGGVWTLIRSLRCEHWPTTEGVIEQAELKYHSSDHGSGSYSASITYDYQVAGVHYPGTRLAFGEMSSSSGYPQGILDRFPVGKKVRVYYSPDVPQLAVLETGIHGGTWVCFGVGTLFVLAGIMFLQIFEKASVAGQIPQTRVVLQQPPVLMGVIFMLMGSFVFFAPPSSGTPRWIVYAAGGTFVVAGLFLLANRLANKRYAEVLKWALVLGFMAIFHWVSFGAGERIGTATTPFSQRNGVNVKSYFAAFTILIDLVLLTALVRRLAQGRKD